MAIATAWKAVSRKGLIGSSPIPSAQSHENIFLECEWHTGSS